MGQIEVECILTRDKVSLENKFKSLDLKPKKNADIACIQLVHTNKNKDGKRESSKSKGNKSVCFHRTHFLSHAVHGW